MAERCDVCGQATPGYDIISCGSMELGYRRLCGACFNAEAAEIAGLEGLKDLKFQPVALADCEGVLHEFYFRTHLFGDGVAIDAFELSDGMPAGYQFQIIGDPQDDLLILLGKLIERMRRSLSVKHLASGEYGLTIRNHQVVRGRIEWDELQDGHVPRLVIDGQEVTWEEFGRMLMTFEGFQFNLRIADKSEEL